MASATGAVEGIGQTWPAKARVREPERSWWHSPIRIQPERNLLRFSVLAFAAGLGLLTVAFADTIARQGSSSSAPVFWAGMLILWVPPTARLAGHNAGRSERIALVVLLGMAMYVVKILYSPRYFVGYDELLHWRTAEDLVRTGKVFNANPLLPVSPLYPGLEIATSAVAKLSGLSAFTAGMLVVGAARLITILSLYLLYERVGGSSWLAGVATAVYFTNPQFLFFDGAYAYESLGLSLALFVLYATVRMAKSREQGWLGATLLVILPLAATAVTHHVTSVLLVIAVTLLAACSLRLDRVATRLLFWGIALLGAGFVLLWLYLVAGQVINYLEPDIAGGVREVIKLIRGEGVTRHLFQGYAGQTNAPLDRVASFVFTAITVLALPLGWLRLWRTRHFDTFTVVFAFCSIAYPASGLFHFTAIGVVLGDRLIAFAFVPVAFCIALAASRREKRDASTARIAALVATGALLLYGGVVTGNAPWALRTGPYLVSADSRSIEPEGIAAATWAGSSLTHGNRIAADRVNSLLMMTYGDQWPVTRLPGGVDVASIFVSRNLTPFARELLRRGSVRYLVVDYRLTRGLPWVGVYYDNDEPGALMHNRPIPAAAYAKFDRTRGASRVFDSGDIVIFDVNGLGRDG